MKFSKFFVLSLLTISINVSHVSGRYDSAERSNRHYMPIMRIPRTNVVEFDLKYDFSVPGETHAISLVVLVPRTIPGRQKILSVKYSAKPLRIFHANGNKYAEFVFRKPQRHEKVTISIKAELFRYDLLTARADTDEKPLDDDRMKEYLAHEKYIECGDDEIRKIAEGINGETELEIVKGIYDYVLDNMDYVVRGKLDKGALAALEQGKGDCTEYSDLFVALCRARNTPARVVSGYTVRADVDTAKHNWVEVYMEDRGWVPFDPTTGDSASEVFRSRAFSRLRPVYICFSHIRNDPVLKNHSFGTYRYWGDGVKLTDSIEFKSPELPTADSR
jgi:transglutaminase-like putative cysteine protease